MLPRADSEALIAINGSRWREPHRRTVSRARGAGLGEVARVAQLHAFGPASRQYDSGAIRDPVPLPGDGAVFPGLDLTICNMQ